MQVGDAVEETLSIPPVTLSDIEDARRLVGEWAVRTPMEESRWLSAQVDGPAGPNCEISSAAGRSRFAGSQIRLRFRARGVLTASPGVPNYLTQSA